MANTVRHRRGLFFILGLACGLLPAFVWTLLFLWYGQYGDSHEFFHARSYLAERVKELAAAEPAQEWSHETLEFHDGRVFTAYTRPSGGEDPDTPILITWPPERNRAAGPYVVVGYADGHVDDINLPEEWNALFQLMTEPCIAEDTPALPAGGSPGG